MFVFCLTAPDHLLSPLAPPESALTAHNQSAVSPGHRFVRGLGVDLLLLLWLFLHLFPSTCQFTALDLDAAQLAGVTGESLQRQMRSIVSHRLLLDH